MVRIGRSRKPQAPEVLFSLRSYLPILLFAILPKVVRTRIRRLRSIFPRVGHGFRLQICSCSFHSQSMTSKIGISLAAKQSAKCKAIVRPISEGFAAYMQILVTMFACRLALSLFILRECIRKFRHDSPQSRVQEGKFSCVFSVSRMRM